MPAVVVGYRGYPIIRDFWDHYTEFADLYDRFAVSSVRAVDELERIFGFAGARVLNVASGSGRDTIELARRGAGRVIGVEPSLEMRTYAIARTRAAGIRNVEFVDGIGEDLGAFRDAEFDCCVSIHGAPFPWDTQAAVVREALRVTRTGGYVAFVGTTPGWRLDHQAADAVEGYSLADPPGLEAAGFTPRDALVELDYGSVGEALATWGCIYGEEAIDYLLDRQTSVLSWSLRIWHRQM